MDFCLKAKYRRTFFGKISKRNIFLDSYEIFYLPRARVTDSAQYLHSEKLMKEDNVFQRITNPNLKKIDIFVGENFLDSYEFFYLSHTREIDSIQYQYSENPTQDDVCVLRNN